MRRYDFDYATPCSGRREVIERKHGDYVIHEDAVRAIDDERLQTQRRMIAALYWRAGLLLVHADDNACGWDEVDAAERDYWQRQSDALTCAARLMEAAL